MRDGWLQGIVGVLSGVVLGTAIQLIIWRRKGDMMDNTTKEELQWWLELTGIPSWCRTVKANLTRWFRRAKV